MFGRNRAALALLAALAAGGCGGKTAKVQGVVTLDGKPLPGATVTFIPAGSGRPAGGRSESDGSFRLTTFRPEDGALPGEYKVIVTLAGAESAPAGADPMKLDDKAKAAFFTRMSPASRAQEEKQQRKAGPAVPEVYTDVSRTPLRCTVPLDGPLELNLRSTAR
jgi:hypothetical protein